MRRVSVVGNSGSGKSTFAPRVAEVLGVPYVELDAIFHLAGWTPMDPDEFLTTVDRITDQPGWVVDGNYRTVVVDGPVWAKADTVVWLDPPDRVLMRQLVGRTARRWVTRAELWNGNRERLSGPFRWDPNQSIIRWGWTARDKYRRRFTAAREDPARARLSFVHLRSRSEADTWLAELRAGGAGGSGVPPAGR